MENSRVTEINSYCGTCQQETTFVKVIVKVGSPGKATEIKYKCLGCGTERVVYYSGT